MVCKVSVIAGKIILFFISLHLINTISVSISNNGNLTTSITNFACKINHQLQSDSNENVFTSSVSAFNVLLLILAGAKGNTEIQMTTAMELQGQDKNVIYDQMKVLISQINKGSDLYTLSTANRVYIQQTLELLPEYTDIIQTYFSGSLEKVDFSKRVQTLKTINDWVSLQTHEKIPSILSDLPVNTRLILINAIYFNASWKYTFDKKLTKSESFTTATEKIVQTEMMKMINPDISFNYTKSNSLGCEVLELPYAGQKISMYIFLPSITTSISSFVKTLNAQKIHEALNKKTPRMMGEIRIPKMHIEKSYDLIPVLKKLGMVDLFSNLADLSRMKKDKGLKVVKVIQKTYLEVNEEGTEAAAATTAIISLRSGLITSEPKINFIANTPFVFIIHDNTNNNDYFMGSFEQP